MNIKQDINNLEAERKALLSKATEMTDKEKERFEEIGKEIKSFTQMLNANERTD